MQHLTFINIKLHLTFYHAAIRNFDNLLQLFAISFNFVYPEHLHIICKLGYNTSVNNLWICRTAQILAQIVWKLFLYLLCNADTHYLFWTFFFSWCFNHFSPDGFPFLPTSLISLRELLLNDHIESFLNSQVKSIDQTLNTASLVMSSKNLSRLVVITFLQHINASYLLIFLFTCGLILFSVTASDLVQWSDLLELWSPGAN